MRGRCVDRNPSRRRGDESSEVAGWRFRSRPHPRASPPGRLRRGRLRRRGLGHRGARVAHRPRLGGAIVIRLRLRLRGETVRVLGAVDLRAANGGAIAESTGVPCITYTSFVSCGTESDVLSHRCTWTWPPP